MTTTQEHEDLTKCPSCGGEADNGHDRCVPPNVYECSKCTQEPQKGTPHNTREVEEMVDALRPIIKSPSFSTGNDDVYIHRDVVVKAIHHQLQKALEIQAIEIREEEANEYNKIIEQELQKERERCITKAWSYIVDATHAESWSRDELRKAVQSELDQPDALTK